MLVEEFKRCINSNVKKVSFVNKANPRNPFYPPSGPKPSPRPQSGNSNQNTLKPKPPGEKRSQTLMSAYLQLLQTIRSYWF